MTAIDAAANESAASGSWSGAAGSGALTTTYAYDAENRLTQLAVDSNVLGTYAYDGAGNRWSKTVVGVKTQYFLDLASALPQVLAEDDGTTISRYAYAAGAPLQLERGTFTFYWYLTDTLGSVRLVTDASGASPATYAYSAFGSTRASTGSLPNEVRFTGERTDTESGLEFLRARTYDPSTGTFLQRDSWGISPTDSQSIDAYVYTANNPINAVDPSGHCAQMAAAGTLAGPGGTAALTLACVATVTAPEWLPAAWAAALAGVGLLGYLAKGSNQPAVPASLAAQPGPGAAILDCVALGYSYASCAKVGPIPTIPPRYIPDVGKAVPLPLPNSDLQPAPPGKDPKLPPWAIKIYKVVKYSTIGSTIGCLIFGCVKPGTDDPLIPAPKASPSPSPAPTGSSGAQSRGASLFWRSRMRAI